MFGWVDFFSCYRQILVNSFVKEEEKKYERKIRKTKREKRRDMRSLQKDFFSANQCVDITNVTLH